MYQLIKRIKIIKQIKRIEFIKPTKTLKLIDFIKLSNLIKSIKIIKFIKLMKLVKLNQGSHPCNEGSIPGMLTTGKALWLSRCPHQELNLGCRGHNATS